MLLNYPDPEPLQRLPKDSHSFSYYVILDTYNTYVLRTTRSYVYIIMGLFCKPTRTSQLFLYPRVKTQVKERHTYFTY